MQNSILVTGASGHLGRRVVELLLERGARVIATTRNPSALADLAARGVDVRRADFEDAQSLPAAFAGAKRALLVSTDALDRPGRRIAQHRTAIAALEAAGVEHVVYTSIPNAPRSSVTIAPDHAQTEEALAASRLGFTILRNNLYTELLLSSLPGAIAAGALVNAQGEGRTAYVTREDCARAAAGALLEAGTARVTLDVTGPEALTGAELAAIASKVTGRPIQYVSVTPDAAIEGMAAHGVPRPFAEVLASFDVAISRGELAGVSDTVVRLGGRAPESVESFLRAHRAALGG